MPRGSTRWSPCGVSDSPETMASAALGAEPGIMDIDEASPGSGLGSAIVRDLVELYGGSISLEESPLAGLRVEVSLPAA